MNRFYAAAPFVLFSLFFFRPSVEISAQASIGICQQVIGATGQSRVKGGIYFAYTVGEPVIATITNQAGTITLTQGFHQPDVCMPVSVNEVTLAEWGIEVFPNPVTDALTVQFAAEKGGPLHASVYDLLGHLILDDLTLTHPTGSSIECGNWQAGIYLLLLQDSATHASATVRFVKL